jgi:hypothetical protein
MNRIARYIPHWLAWPVNLLSTLTALGGAALIFYGAAFADGDLKPFIWGGIVFVIAAVLWHIADMAAANRPV